MEEKYFNKHLPFDAFQFLVSHPNEKVREAAHILFWNIQVRDDRLSREPSYEQFSKIADLRHYLLKHPNGEMVKTSCAHLLGDAVQEFLNRLKIR